MTNKIKTVVLNFFAADKEYHKWTVGENLAYGKVTEINPSLSLEGGIEVMVGDKPIVDIPKESIGYVIYFS